MPDIKNFLGIDIGRFFSQELIEPIPGRGIPGIELCGRDHRVRISSIGI